MNSSGGSTWAMPPIGGCPPIPAACEGVSTSRSRWSCPPRVLFLDEPTTGLDPRSRRDVWDLVSALRDQNVTVLLTTQYLEEADVLSDSIIVLDSGRVVASGTADDLKRRVGVSYCQVTPRRPDRFGRNREPHWQISQGAVPIAAH